MVAQFIHDMVHMTEGEKLVSYWPLWSGIAVICITLGFICRNEERR